MTDAMYPMPEAELAAIDRAAQAFRERWASIKSPPWPAAFGFTLTDVRTIDYMEYEGIAFPECGMDGAVLICAEVVRRAAQLEWFMSYRGEWILAEAKPGSGVAVAPRARFHEYECGRRRQFDNFLDLMAELALACIWAEHGDGLLKLFSQGGEYFDLLERRIQRIRRGWM